jgi:hypothetical protein
VKEMPSTDRLLCMVPAQTRRPADSPPVRPFRPPCTLPYSKRDLARRDAPYQGRQHDSESKEWRSHGSHDFRPQCGSHVNLPLPYTGRGPHRVPRHATPIYTLTMCYHLCAQSSPALPPAHSECAHDAQIRLQGNAPPHSMSVHGVRARRVTYAVRHGRWVQVQTRGGGGLGVAGGACARPTGQGRDGTHECS